MRTYKQPDRNEEKCSGVKYGKVDQYQKKNYKDSKKALKWK